MLCWQCCSLPYLCFFLRDEPCVYIRLFSWEAWLAELQTCTKRMGAGTGLRHDGVTLEHRLRQFGKFTTNAWTLSAKMLLVNCNVIIICITISFMANGLCTIILFGASLSEPHLVSSTAALSIYLFIYIYPTSYIVHTWSLVQHMHSLCCSRSQNKSVVPRPTLERWWGDSSRGLYGLPGRSAERSQASGSDKLAGGSKHMTARISIARLEQKQTCGGGQAPHQYKHRLLTQW